MIESLGNWGARWAFGNPRPDELDPVLLLWRMRRRINLDLLPPRPVLARLSSVVSGDTAFSGWCLSELRPPSALLNRGSTLTRSSKRTSRPSTKCGWDGPRWEKLLRMARSRSMGRRLSCGGFLAGSSGVRFETRYALQPFTRHHKRRIEPRVDLKRRPFDRTIRQGATGLASILLSGLIPDAFPD